MQGQTANYVITKLITPPFTSSLTTLSNVKDELTIDSDNSTFDKVLKRYIAEESARIAGECNRVFGLATWQDEFRPQESIRGEGVSIPNNPLMLSRWPLTANVVSLTGSIHGTKIVDALSSTVGLYAGQLIFGAGIVNGTTIVSVNAMSGSLLLSTVATATSQGVALTTGLQVTETVGGVGKVLTYGTDFEVGQGTLLPGDEGVGELYRLNQNGNPRNWAVQKIVVMYQAGYCLPGSPLQNLVPTMPADLEGVCLETVTGRYRGRGRDPLVRAFEQPNLGRTEYWVGAAPGQSGPYPNEIMSVLNRYRQPVTRSA